jgi:hypothetical protein
LGKGDPGIGLSCSSYRHEYKQYCLDCGVNVFIVTMTIWKPDLSRFKGPKHLALAEAIREAVDAGTLPPDSQLPPQRDLAFALGLSLGTVTRAYKDAERRGLLRGEVGRGTFVHRPESGSGPPNLSNAAHADEGPIDLVMNLPPPGSAERCSVRHWRRWPPNPGLPPCWIISAMDGSNGIPGRWPHG